MDPRQSVTLRNNVRAELARRGLRHRHVAAHLGITPQAVSHKLRGKRPFTVDELEAVAKLLGVHPGSLFDEQVPA